MNATDATVPGPVPEGRRSPGVPIGAVAGDRLGGRFLLRQVLGHGATGTVFAALDTSVGQKVAIKLLHTDLRDATTYERLRREVRAARHGHPNLVAVHDLHEDGERLWISMELVEGENLKQRLAEHRKLEPEEVTAIGRQVAAALEHLHGLGLIHRDVKPGNILLTADGTARLCDMGLTRPIEEGMTITGTEMVVGTPAYMAPEQGLGSGLTAASDIYGLGMTLYQCLAGTVPLTSETAVATLTRRQREAPPSIRRTRPEAPRWLARLLARMLAARVHDRPSASTVRKVFENRHMWPRPRRRTLAGAAALAAVAAVAAIATPWILHRETVRFEVDGAAAHGLDAEGRRTWTHELPAPSTSHIETDLDGDGDPELVIAGRSAAAAIRSEQERRSYVLALGNRGGVLTRMVPEELIESWESWKFPYRIELRPLIFAFDLDQDGRQELVVNCQHALFYPAVVVIYWPRWDRWEITLDHPGHLTVLAPGTTDGRPGLRFVGLNNLLGLTPVYGEIALVPPGDRPGLGGLTPGLGSPPRDRLHAGVIGTWRSYLPLDEAAHGIGLQCDRIVSHPDGSVEIGRGEGAAYRLDRFGNPVPGPNQGRDLRGERIEFMNSLSLLMSNTRAITAAGVHERISRFRSAGGPLLEEPPYQLALAVVGARALALAGDLDGALELLRATAERHPDEDLRYLAGHLEAIAGDLTAARATVLELVDTGTSSRSHYDGLTLLLQIATALGDRETVAAATNLVAPSSELLPEHRLRRKLFAAQARLWWDESFAADCDLQSTPLAAEGEAVGCLARWRLGRSEPADVERMVRFIELNPDGAGLGRVALAAAQLGRPDPRAALTVLDTAMVALESTATYDFGDHQSLALARALRAVALEAAGERDRAAALAEELARDQPSDLLPGILAREVLARQTD